MSAMHGKKLEMRKLQSEVTERKTKVGDINSSVECLSSKISTTQKEASSRISRKQLKIVGTLKINE